MWLLSTAKKSVLERSRLCEAQHYWSHNNDKKWDRDSPDSSAYPLNPISWSSVAPDMICEWFWLPREWLDNFGGHRRSSLPSIGKRVPLESPPRNQPRDDILILRNFSLLEIELIKVFTDEITSLKFQLRFGILSDNCVAHFNRIVREY